MQTPNGDKLTVISLSASKDPELPQRTIILESSGNTYEFTEPVIEDREIAFFYSLQKSIAFSPNGESMVFSGTPGTIFEFFSLKDGIERLCIKRILPPSVTLSNGSYRQNDDYIFGSGKLCTTDSFVYSAYDGKHTAREWRASNNACLLYNNIAVFDWKGNPKDLYTTDYRIMCLSVENDSTVFACLEDIEGRIFIGKAKLMQ